MEVVLVFSSLLWHKWNGFSNKINKIFNLFDLIGKQFIFAKVPLLYKANQ